MVPAGAIGSIFALKAGEHVHPQSPLAAPPPMARSLLVPFAAVIALSAGCAPRHEHLVHVIAERAPGLKPNARVQYRGVDVGHVKAVYFTNGGVRIDLVIERDDVPIRARDTVRIASSSAFGAQVVDIQPGDSTAALLARGATLPRAQAESTVTVPVGVWRSIVQRLGLATTAPLDSAAHR